MRCDDNGKPLPAKKSKPMTPAQKAAAEKAKAEQDKLFYERMRKEGIYV